MSQIATVRTVADLRARVSAWRAAGHRVAMTPTMGALHQGHLSLIAEGLRRADHVVASVFVNPMQFGPDEDYSAYPRGEARDTELLQSAGCELLYAPSAAEMYPQGFATTVSVVGVTDTLEGAARPGHFGGVATVVAKLLIQATPDVAIFGEKDFQQLLVIRRMVRDLDLSVEIVAAPIARDEHGLALSSRNAYLSGAELTVARRLNVILRHAADRARAGEAIATITAEAKAELTIRGFQVDYVAIVNAEDLTPFAHGIVYESGRILAAARLGRTRLIDNLPV